MEQETVKVKTIEEALPHLAAGQSVIITLISKQAWQILEAIGTVEYEVGEDTDQFRNWFRIHARGGLLVGININRNRAEALGAL